MLLAQTTPVLCVRKGVATQTGYVAPPCDTSKDKKRYTLCPTGWQNFVPKGAESRKHAQPESGVVTDVATADEGTV